GLDVQALLERLAGLPGVELDAVRGAVRPPVRMTEVEAARPDLVPQAEQAGAVRGRVRVAGEAVGGPVDLDGVAGEHRALPVDLVGHRPGRVTWGGVAGDRAAAPERER